MRFVARLFSRGWPNETDPGCQKAAIFQAPLSPGADAWSGDQIPQPSNPRSHYSNPALQSLLRILQRIRQGFQPCTNGGNALSRRSSGSSRHRNHYFSGGEPLLHPELDERIRRIRVHGIIATVITNGYLLTPERIQRLNHAGLEHLQISIDNVQPDDHSRGRLGG